MRRRSVLIGVALSVAVALASLLVLTQPRTLVTCSPIEKPFQGQYVTHVSLTVKNFQPQGAEFNGSFASVVELPEAAEISGPNGKSQRYDGSRYVSPDPKVLKDDLKEMQETFQRTILRFNHNTDDHSFEEQGGSLEPFAMRQPELRNSLEGSGAFTWSASTMKQSFYYPFDQYVLAVNPELLTEVNSDIFKTYAIDNFSVDFGGTGFIPELEFQGNLPQLRDRYSLIVRRPALLRVMTGVVGVLLVAWLIFLMTSPKVGEQAGQVVTLFVGVFSIRNSLLSGAPVFPCLIDYCALGVYLSAVLIVLIRWFIPDRRCPKCFSSVAEKAAVCAACAREIYYEVDLQ